MTVGIIVKKYSHYNRAMGMFISSKHQYDNECAKRHLIPSDEAHAIAQSAREKAHKPYDTISSKAWDIIKAAKNSKNKKGKVKLSDRTIDAMIEIGVNFYNKNIPKHYQPEGGFKE